MTRKLRILLVDDEALARSRARRLLDGLDVDIVGEADSAESARGQLHERDVDVMLLDVQMPGEDGFALLSSLSERPAVIFVTAFDHYAVQAFEENAVDYLLKPFRRERLAEALDRVRRTESDLPDRLERLLSEIRSRDASTHLERLTVRTGQRQLVLRVADVLWFGAEDKLVFAATRDKRHYVNLTLDQLEGRLDPRLFARVHRSAIVNLDEVAALQPAFAGTYRVQLRDDARTEVPVSRARVRDLKQRLGA